MITGMLFSANYYITPKGRKCAIQQSNRRKKFGRHSARSAGATIIANKGVPDRLFKLHGRWVSDKAKDAYVKDNSYILLWVTRNLRLYVYSLQMG